MSKIKTWLEAQLHRMLGFDEVGEIASHLLTFSSSQTAELRLYLEQFLGDSKEVRDLCSELIKRLGNEGVRKGTKTEAKGDFWDATTSEIGHASNQTARQGQRQGQGNKGKGKGRGKVYQKIAAEDFWGGGTSSSMTSVPTTQPVATPLPTTNPSRTIPTQSGKKKKAPSTTAPSHASTSGGKSKGGGTQQRPTVKAASPQPSTKSQLPPQKWSGVTCTCMAIRHSLITNCTTCGKIACEAEGGYECSFCRSPLPVTGREPTATNSYAGSANDQPQSAALAKAVARKEKLLLFDRTSVARTRVLDDQGDHFSTYNWLSREERERAEANEVARKEEQLARRRKVTVSFDIMGRKVVEADNEETPQSSGEAVTTLGEQRDAQLQGSGDNSPESRAGENKQSSLPDRPSLHNSGLQGRAKEVYDIMRANLDKRQRHVHGTSRRSISNRSTRDPRKA